MASNQAAKGRSPDFRVTCMDTATKDRSGTLGAAWKNEDGSIRIKLSPGVTLTNALSVVLWPADEPGSPRTTRQTGGALTGSRSASRPTGFDDMDDDIPF